MDNTTKLAKHIKSEGNFTPYTPIFGEIISLPEVKIRIGSRVVLTTEDIKTTFDIYEKEIHDGYSKYVNLNKTAVLLPYSSDNKFVVIGVVQE